MFMNRINFKVAGITMAFGGSLFIYFFSYKNSQVFDIIAYILIMLGWAVLFGEVTRGTLIAKKRLPFNNGSALFFKQLALKIVGFGLLGGIMFANIFYLPILAGQRVDNILQDGPTKTTIATINDIETRNSRSGTSYYAIFQYTVDGKLIRRSRYEDRNEFFESEKFEISYSVQYPDMFEIIKKLP
jgi:hypothetical protein